MPDSPQQDRLELLARHHALLSKLIEAGATEDEVIDRMEQEFSALEKAVLLSMFREDERHS